MAAVVPAPFRMEYERLRAKIRAYVQNMAPNRPTQVAGDFVVSVVFPSYEDAVTSGVMGMGFAQLYHGSVGYTGVKGTMPEIHNLTTKTMSQARRLKVIKEEMPEAARMFTRANDHLGEPMAQTEGRIAEFVKGVKDWIKTGVYHPLPYLQHPAGAM